MLFPAFLLKNVGALVISFIYPHGVFFHRNAASGKSETETIQGCTSVGEKTVFLKRKWLWKTARIGQAHPPPKA